jgi:hypothetical protein
MDLLPANTEEAQLSLGVTEGVASPVTTVPRRRGRPPFKARLKTAAPLPVLAGDSPEVSEEAPEFPRRRGRPPKKKDE